MAQSAIRANKRSTTDGAVRVSERTTRRKVTSTSGGDDGKPGLASSLASPSTTTKPQAPKAVAAAAATSIAPGMLQPDASCTLGVPLHGGVDSLKNPTLPGPVLGVPSFPAAVPPFPCPPPAMMMFMMQQHMQRMQQAAAMACGWGAAGMMPGLNPMAPMGCAPPYANPMGMSLPLNSMLGMQSCLGNMPALPPTNTPFPLNLQLDLTSAAAGKAVACGPCSTTTASSGAAAVSDSGDSSTHQEGGVGDCTDLEFHGFLNSFLTGGVEDKLPDTGDAALDFQLDLSDLVVGGAPGSPVHDGEPLDSLLDTLDKPTAATAE